MKFLEWFISLAYLFSGISLLIILIRWKKNLYLRKKESQIVWDVSDFFKSNSKQACCIPFWWFWVITITLFNDCLDVWNVLLPVRKNKNFKKRTKSSFGKKIIFSLLHVFCFCGWWNYIFSFYSSFYSLLVSSCFLTPVFFSLL